LALVKSQSAPEKSKVKTSRIMIVTVTLVSIPAAASRVKCERIYMGITKRESIVIVRRRDTTKVILSLLKSSTPEGFASLFWRKS
jgi:hypothetical protein